MVSFDNLDSIIKVVPFPEASDRPMMISLDDDKISVYLSKPDFRQYALVRSSSLSPILASLIVLPVICDAVRAIMDDRERDLDWRWSRAIRERMEKIKPHSDDPLACAQQLLELPIRRSLAAALSSQDIEG